MTRSRSSAKSAGTIARALARLEARAAAIRNAEVDRSGPFASEEHRQTAADMVSRTYLWKRIELWEAVERLKIEVVGSLPFVGTWWLNRRWLRDAGEAGQ